MGDIKPYNLVPECLHKPGVILDNSKNVSIEEDGKDVFVGKLLSGEQVDVLDANIESQSHNWSLASLGGDVSHQGQVLD